MKFIGDRSFQIYAVAQQQAFYFIQNEGAETERQQFTFLKRK